MEAEDKKIKTWLEDHFIEKAPDGFTGKVMDAVEATELQKQERSADWPYLLAAAAAVLAAFCVLFIVDPSFISQSSGYASRFFMQLADVFSFSTSGITSAFSGGQLVAGTLIIILVLLTFDALVWKGKRGVHMFLWI